MLSLRGVTKSFDGGTSYAVSDVSLEVAEGETMVLLGSSGCGKTTTLKMINRLVDLSDGEIVVDNKNIMEQDPVELRRSIGYVFQGIGLFPHMTVEQNVSVVLKLTGADKDKRKSRAREMLELVDLDPDTYADRFPAELSGGQKQRVGVARALAADPKYLLMDEPFGALDAITRDSLQKELMKIKERLRKTIVFVTHDIFEALTLADRIAVMHEGKLEQVGTNEEIMTCPATDFVRWLFEKPARQLKVYTEQMNG